MNTPARLGAYAAGLGAIFTAGDLAPGLVSKLVFTVSKDGRPVGDLVTIHAGGAAFAASAPSGGDSPPVRGLRARGNRPPAARRERKEW